MTGEQLNLLVPAREGRPTQAAGAAAAAPHADRQGLVILRALAMLGPMTRDKICRLTHVRASSACARLAAMMRPNRHSPAIVQQTFRPLVAEAAYTRKSDAGVEVTVYEITAAGRAAL